MITSEQIAAAKARTRHQLNEVHHETDDCIRIAYEWLDAQVRTQGFIKRAYPIKHMIENWAGRYVSTSDVEVAAELHSEIKGTYPRFNISSRFTMPSRDRLKDISEAGTQGYKNSEADVKRIYSRTE
jgi:hypothetical protein